MQYIENPKVDLDQLLDLYKSVGWTSYTGQPEMLKNAYRHSLYTLAAYDGERLIGIIRAVGDGYSILFIQDLLILPEFQRQGIGTTLLKKVIESFPNVYQLHLLTDNSEKTRKFYESVGFKDVKDIQCTAFTFIGKDKK